MKVRKATDKDFEEVKYIYFLARSFMREQGNPGQWGESYPADSLIRSDIQNEALYVITDGAVLHGAFYFKEGEDPTYRVIYDGEWLNSEPYAVIHRVAVRTPGKGIVGSIFDYCASRCTNLRIDTHRDNLPMQGALLKHGFSFCGVVHLEDGSERLAYQKNIIG